MPIVGSIAYVFDTDKVKKYFYINNGWVEIDDTEEQSSASGSYPIVQISAQDSDDASTGDSPSGLILQSNKCYIIGSAEDPVDAIYISGLTESLNGYNNEFIFEFYSNNDDQSPTSFALDENLNIQWVNELTIENNKHYQISILNGIALWCAVDISTTQEVQS